MILQLIIHYQLMMINYYIVKVYKIIRVIVHGLHHLVIVMIYLLIVHQ